MILIKYSVNGLEIGGNNQEELNLALSMVDAVQAKFIALGGIVSVKQTGPNLNGSTPQGMDGFRFLKEEQAHVVKMEWTRNSNEWNAYRLQCFNSRKSPSSTMQEINSQVEEIEIDLDDNPLD